MPDYRKHNGDTGNVCTRVFAKIAQEGRKYGLGLVLSPQRPSELSPTVISQCSQCNSFLLHRLSNEQETQSCLVGWASELPVRVRMNYLNEHFRPKSGDPKYQST